MSNVFLHWFSKYGIELNLGIRKYLRHTFVNDYLGNNIFVNSYKIYMCNNVR